MDVLYAGKTFLQSRKKNWCKSWHLPLAIPSKISSPLHLMLLLKCRHPILHYTSAVVFLKMSKMEFFKIFSSSKYTRISFEQVRYNLMIFIDALKMLRLSILMSHYSNPHPAHRDTPTRQIYLPVASRQKPRENKTKRKLPVKRKTRGQEKK